MTAAAVAIETQAAKRLRAALAQNFPKWRDCALEDAETVIDTLIREAAAVSAVTVYKDTEAWRKFWSDAEPLHKAILAQDRRVAGFAKPANVVMYWLFGQAFGLATAHAVKIGPNTIILDCRGRAVIERTVVCDSDVKGEENIEVFKNLWECHDRSQPRMERLGLRFYTRDVVVTTEHDEPLLLYADYLAGLVHAAFITDRGRIPLPLTLEESRSVLNRLSSTGKLALHLLDFDLVYADVFGEAYRRATDDNAY